ncbi:MAG TPA: PepSY domain-containing protein [Verrucomicrobiae bacterium]|nr:PepSY domain-containing protein [Verrucomicrobiae bacterium]
MQNPTVSKSKYWLLAKSRQWHAWAGLAAGLFLLVVGVSGIVLNYEHPIFSALGLETRVPKSKKEHRQTKQLPPQLSMGNGFAALPVSIERAFEIARAEWGDVPLERVELKDERGEMLYKFKHKNGSELWINAVSGAHLKKGAYERVGKAALDGTPTRSTDWGKILIDLHTGKIGGEAGKAVMSLVSLLLILLSLSGVYMWLKPLVIRRRNAKAKAIASQRLISTEAPGHRAAEAGSSP